MKSVQLENDFHKRLKRLSTETEKSIKELIKEALNLLFEKYKEIK